MKNIPFYSSGVHDNLQTVVTVMQYFVCVCVCVCVSDSSW